MKKGDTNINTWYNPVGWTPKPSISTTNKASLEVRYLLTRPNTISTQQSFPLKKPFIPSPNGPCGYEH